MSDMKDVTDQKRKPLVKMNALDKAIAYFAPQNALERAHARARLSLVGGYKAADRTRNANKKRGISGGSADSEITPYIDTLRSDSRDLMRNEPIARGAINTVVTNVVGTGLFPQARPDRDVLKARAGLNDDQIDQLEIELEREFFLWGKNKACDATMYQTFVGMQSLVFRSVLESGDLGILRRMITRPGARYQTALQLIEADRIDNPLGKTDTATMQSGIVRDSYGAPIGFHVLKSHPGNARIEKDRFKTEFFKANFSNGDWQFLLLMHRERPEQSRGVPYLAPVIELFAQLGKYTDAEVMAAVISAMFTVFIKTDDGQGLAPLQEEQGASASASSDDIALGNGSIFNLANGESIEIADPNRPNQAFDAFVMAVLRQAGAALEIPFELLVKHFTASYSAAQAAMLEAWKFFKARRTWVVEQFGQPVYEAVITEAVARGYVNAPGFFNDPLLREAYLMTEWIGPPRGMIDQLKEVRAAEIMQNNGWKTGQSITAELTGGDWDQNHERLVKEKKKRDDAGLKSPGEREQAATDAMIETPADEADENDKRK